MSRRMFVLSALGIVAFAFVLAVVSTLMDGSFFVSLIPGGLP